MAKKKTWQIVVPADFETTSKEYKINGRIYYRVTTTLGVLAKHRLFNWAAKIGYAQANKILETRQQIGIHLHKLIELTLKDEPLNLGSYETEIKEGMCRFNEFRKAAELEPQGIEQRLWSNTHGYAGTADFIGYYKSPYQKDCKTQRFMVRNRTPKFTEKSFVIGDWKSGKDFYPSYWLQLTAYAFAFKELTGHQVDGAFICRIRDGKLKVEEMAWKELEVLFPAYLAILEVYEWKYSLGKYSFLKKSKKGDG